MASLETQHIEGIGQPHRASTPQADCAGSRYLIVRENKPSQQHCGPQNADYPIFILDDKHKAEAMCKNNSTNRCSWRVVIVK